MKDQIKKILFKKMQELPDERGLQIFEFVSAFNRASGETLDSYRTDLDDSINDLDQLKYIRYVHPGGRMGMFFKGLNFDKWSNEMTSKNNNDSANGNSPGHNFNFYATVGSVQTGSNATANVVQTFAGIEKDKLIDALRELQNELVSAQMAESDRTDITELATETIGELERATPNKLKLTSALSAIGTAVQTCAAAPQAYQLLKSAAAPFGIHLP